MARGRNVVHVSILTSYVQDEMQSEANIVVDPDDTAEQAIE